jgi:hypothetical protein
VIDLVGNNARLLDHYLVPFILTFICVSLAFAGMLFMIGRVLSARIAGPLYAFEKWLDDLSHGHSRPLHLRKGDEFRHLEELAERLTQRVTETRVFPVAKSSNGESGTSVVANPEPALIARPVLLPDDGTEPGVTYVSAGDEFNEPLEAKATSPTCRQRTD